MDFLTDLSEREQDLIIRAGAHALAETALPEAARFRLGVTDLDVARLLHQLERGAVITPTVTDGFWSSNGPVQPHLSRLVRECLRLGLVRRITVVTGPHTRRTQLEAAAVHLRTGVNVVACGLHHRHPYWRHRSLDDRRLVDCTACLQY